MMVLSEMVRSRSSSFKSSFRKKSENISKQFSSNGKNSSTKQTVVSGGEYIKLFHSRNIDFNFQNSPFNTYHYRSAYLDALVN